MACRNVDELAAFGNGLLPVDDSVLIRTYDKELETSKVELWGVKVPVCTLDRAPGYFSLGCCSCLRNIKTTGTITDSLGNLVELREL